MTDLPKDLGALPPLPPDARMGRWPAWGPAADLAVDEAVHWLGRPSLLVEKDFRNRLSIILYGDLPMRQGKGRRTARPGAELGFWDPRHIAHTAKYRSLPAKAGDKRCRRPGTVAEHVVPMGLVEQMLEATGGDRELVRNVLSRYYIIARCTREEDRLLEAAGLRQRMPRGWRPGGDPWARWAAVGLVALPPEEQWVSDLSHPELAALWRR